MCSSRAGPLTLGIYCWRFPYTFARWLMRNTVAKIIGFQRFLDLSGHNKPMLLLADFIYVPIEHTMKLHPLRIIGCCWLNAPLLRVDGPPSFLQRAWAELGTSPSR